MLFVMDIHVVMVEGGERTDDPDHDRHRVSVAAKAPEETNHRFVQHGVAGYGAIEVIELGFRR